MRDDIYSREEECFYDSSNDERGARSKGGVVKYVLPVLAATLCAGVTMAATDGSNEPGFVAPPRDPLLPPAPPRTASSAETFIPGGCTTPMARTESKKPPRPPTLVAKLKSE